MGIATQQEVENKGAVADRKWSVKKLFPTAAVASAISKTFVNVFDLLLGVLSIVISASALIHQSVSPELLIITGFMLLASFKIKQTEASVPKEKT